SVAQHLSVLALRSVFEGAAKLAGMAAGAGAADSVTGFLGARFTNHSGRLLAALQKANAAAWRAFEVALAGDSWWERIKVGLARKEDRTLREQVTVFLEATPLGGLPSHGAEFRQMALRDLRAAHKQGLLSGGALDPAALARAAGPF